jgi:predicted Zn-dependent protease
MTPMLSGNARDRFLLWIPVSFCWVFVSCTIQRNIPTVVDDRVEALLRGEAARIVAVSEDGENFSKYQFFLSDFPRKDILGMSIGKGRIYISYKLVLLALTDSTHRWLLRQTLAHEIAHETADHAKQEGVMGLNRGIFAVGGASGGRVGLPWYVRLYNYSTEKELEADLKGLGYWNKIGWDCRIWVGILEDLQNKNYTGDAFHPTDRRLRQAQSVCELERGEKPSDAVALPAERGSVLTLLYPKYTVVVAKPGIVKIPLAYR